MKRSLASNCEELVGCSGASMVIGDVSCDGRGRWLRTVEEDSTISWRAKN